MLLLAGLLSTSPGDDAGSRCAQRGGDSPAEPAPASQPDRGASTDPAPGPMSTPHAVNGTGEPSDPDDLLLAVEPLYPDRPRRLPETRRRTLRDTMRLAASVASVVALAAVVVSSVRQANQPSHPAPAPTPVSRLPGGWTVAGPPYAQAVAFASSAPGTAYTCGDVPLDEPGAPPAIYIGISHDYGRSWQTLPSPLQSPWCDISVDPTNPQDAALITLTCATCSANPSLSVYRTVDGGVNWSQWPLPAWGTGGSNDFSGYEWAWAGSTLYFAQAIDDGRTGYTVLAASVNQGPFVWVGQHALFADEPAIAGIDGLIGFDGALYVTFNCGPGCPLTSTHTMRSSDGGATWTSFDPTFGGRPVYLVRSPAASAGLFGVVDPGSADGMGSGAVLRSDDGGATWRPMPPFPRSLGLLDISAAPDGTAYARLSAYYGPADRTTPEGIYKLAPGSTLWSFVGQFLAVPSPPIVLSWDTAGHPRAIWSATHPQAGPFKVSPGMAYHLP